MDAQVPPASECAFSEPPRRLGAKRRRGHAAATAFVGMLLAATTARAQYVNRFSTITNGAITFAGNTLGLSKEENQNQPGTQDSIGAFATTNTALKVGSYPAGTTLTFASNSSTATLNLPTGSTVLRAELTWAGSWSYGGQNVSASRNNAVSLTTPAGTFSVSPDLTFQRNLGTGTPGGSCTSVRASTSARRT